MSSNEEQDKLERDELWESLEALRTEINQLAAGRFEPSEREQKIVTLIARIVLAELDFRRREKNLQ